MLRSLSILLLLLCLSSCSTGGQAPAKNVILFIGDGMGVSTVTAARIYDGQTRGEPGEENLLSFERFPRTAMVKTYNTNQQVSDSAGTATAMHTGVKTRAGVINIGPDARRRDCAEALANPLEIFGERVRREGMSLGIVTTTRVTHATPATVYAAGPERDWESDEYMYEADFDAGCIDIATQLVQFGNQHGFDLVLGGGAREFYGAARGGKRRTPDDDLVSEWLAGGEKRVFIDGRSELARIEPQQDVLGLFSQSHMTYVAQREDNTTEPTLQEMTAAAIDHLEAQDGGYYLMVEGGRIDHGHHDGYPAYALIETQAFSEAIQIALDKVDLDETLVLVTADHSHVFTIAGYPTRGNPILGLVVENDKSGEPKPAPAIAADGKPYATLGYMNGPGAKVDAPRGVPETGIHDIRQAYIPRRGTNLDGTPSYSETHGGEDVTLYAIGNGADCVAGVIEQNVIFDVMTAALGWRAPICDD